MPTHFHYRLVITNQENKTIVVTPNSDDENLFQMRDRINESGFKVSAIDITMANLFGRYINRAGIYIKSF